MRLFGRSAADDADADTDLDIEIEEPETDPDADPEPEPEPEPTPKAWAPDDAFMDALADKVAGKLKPPKPEEKPPEPTDDDQLFREIASQFYDDPAGALRRAVELGAERGSKKTLEQLSPFVQSAAPLINDSAFQKATAGLSEGERAEAAAILQEKEWNPAAMADPAIAEIVTSMAFKRHFEKSGKANERRVPGTEGVLSVGGLNVDADTRKELNGLSKLYSSLGIKMDPKKLIGGGR